jgi:hypothetical protein
VVGRLLKLGEVEVVVPATCGVEVVELRGSKWIMMRGRSPEQAPLDEYAFSGARASAKALGWRDELGQLHQSRRYRNFVDAYWEVRTTRANWGNAERLTSRLVVRVVIIPATACYVEWTITVPKSNSKFLAVSAVVCLLPRS